MKRRKFIKVTGLVSGTVLVSGFTGACSNGSHRIHRRDVPEGKYEDIRLQVLSYAILSPNPHNIQPWLIDITGELSFNLYVDRDRLLPETDPFYRQIHIGQGAFLEGLVVAASGLKHEAKITFFPQRMYGNREIDNKAIASIELVPNSNIEVNPLFHFLFTRQSNKRNYDNTRLSKEELALINNSLQSSTGKRLAFFDSDDAKNSMVCILTEAMTIEVRDKCRDLETIRMFRFNDKETNKFRDGFGLAQSGITGFKKLIAETFFLSRESVENDSRSFGEHSVNLAKKSAESTATFALLITSSNTRLDQVKIGMDYCRINLQTTSMNIAQHPMSQVLQEYTEMLPLQEIFKSRFDIEKNETVQMLFRLGRAKSVEHTKRRKIHQLIYGFSKG